MSGKTLKESPQEFPEESVGISKNVQRCRETASNRSSGIRNSAELSSSKLTRRQRTKNEQIKHGRKENQLSRIPRRIFIQFPKVVQKKTSSLHRYMKIKRETERKRRERRGKCCKVTGILSKNLLGASKESTQTGTFPRKSWERGKKIKRRREKEERKREKMSCITFSKLRKTGESRQVRTCRGRCANRPSFVSARISESERLRIFSHFSRRPAPDSPQPLPRSRFPAAGFPAAGFPQPLPRSFNSQVR